MNWWLVFAELFFTVWAVAVFAAGVYAIIKNRGNVHG